MSYVIKVFSITKKSILTNVLLVELGIQLVSGAQQHELEGHDFGYLIDVFSAKRISY